MSIEILLKQVRQEKNMTLSMLEKKSGVSRTHINDIENNKRGIYGGAIGYLDFTGNLDSCIGIRIAYKKNGKVFVRSGAGIVADSIPEKEYEGVTIPSGNYESLVITLGSGLGDNWWCVMFPPLCLLEAKDNNTENIEYKFLVQEILEKYTS